MCQERQWFEQIKSNKKTTFIHLVFRLVTLVNVDIVLILNWTLEMMHKQMSKLLAIYMFTLLHSYTLRVKKPLQTDAIKFSLNVQKKNILCFVQRSVPVRTQLRIKVTQSPLFVYFTDWCSSTAENNCKTNQLSGSN